MNEFVVIEKTTPEEIVIPNEKLEYIEPVTQEKTANPTTSTQIITPDENYTGLSKVTINAVTSTIDSNIQPGNIKNNVSILGVTGNLSIKEEEEKTVSLDMSSGDQIITPTTDKLLSQVTVTKPSTLIPTNIKKDIVIGGVTGSFDTGYAYLTSYAEDMGLTPSTSNYGTNVHVVGETIPNYMFYYYPTSQGTGGVKNIIIETTVKNLGNSAFLNALTPITLQENVKFQTIDNGAFSQARFSTNITVDLSECTSLGQSAFAGTSSRRVKVDNIIFGDNQIAIKTSAFQYTSLTELITNKISTVGTRAFDNTLLQKISLKNLTNGLTSSYSPFGNNSNLVQISLSGANYGYGSSNKNSNAILYGCPNLKAVWIDHLGTSSTLLKNYPQSAFLYMVTSNLEYLFIDAPRSVVEALTYYSTKFGSTSTNLTIIANDDANWLTQDEFDATDWSTYNL